MPSRPRPELPGAEMKRRRRKGLCLSCGKAGHEAGSCPDKAKTAVKQLENPAEHNRLKQLKKDGRGSGKRTSSKKRHRPIDELRLEQHGSGSNLEPLGKRIKLDNTTSTFQRHDSVIIENDLQHDHTSLDYDDHPPVQPAPIIKKKPLMKRQLLAQYLPGFSYPGGPNRLIHGSKVALQDLELALTKDGLVLHQQSSTRDISNSLITALEVSTKHLVTRGEFPVAFFATIEDLRVSMNTTLFGDNGPTVFDLREVMEGLKDAGSSMATIGKLQTFTYRLGIVMSSGRGLSLMRRARLIEEESTERPHVGQKRTIWLYLRMEEYGEGVKVAWSGFKQVMVRANRSVGLVMR